MGAAVRMQFYAIEIARCVQSVRKGCSVLIKRRNRAGLNDWVYEQAHVKDSKK